MIDEQALQAAQAEGFAATNLHPDYWRSHIHAACRVAVEHYVRAVDGNRRLPTVDELRERFSDDICSDKWPEASEVGPATALFCREVLQEYAQQPTTIPVDIALAKRIWTEFRPFGDKANALYMLDALRVVLGDSIPCVVTDGEEAARQRAITDQKEAEHKKALEAAYETRCKLMAEVERLKAELIERGPKPKWTTATHLYERCAWRAGAVTAAFPPGQNNLVDQLREAVADIAKETT